MTWTKERVVQELNAIITDATDYEKWTLTKALRNVQATVTKTGLPGALWNAIVVPDVFPNLSVKVRQEVMRVINHVTSNEPDNTDDQ